MKKLFNHRKRPYEDESCYTEWEDEELESEDGAYDSDGGEQDVDQDYADSYEDEDGEADTEDEEYYTGEADAEDGEFYAEEADEDNQEYYAEEADAEDEEYYADEADAEDEEYYADEADAEDEEYYADEADEEDGSFYSKETDAEDEEYYADEAGEEDGDFYPENPGRQMAGNDRGRNPERDRFSSQEKGNVTSMSGRSAAGGKRNAGTRRKKAGAGSNIFVKGWTAFMHMGTMDRIILSTGVAVLVLALVTGSVYFSARLLDQQVSSFSTVGQQLAGINLIGENGLLAVADAEQAKIAAANAVLEEHAQQVTNNEEKKDYEEEEYTKDVTVALNMTSIQKDLKIKFINKKTGKLIANVPFKVTVTDPNGKSSTWEDDDMDGIIYKKDITPGKYKVAMEDLSGEKYKNYTIPEAQEKIDVKKDIEYKKVDVSNEIKSESEINVKKEDTKVNDTKVESKLTDTVGWVESTSANSNYKEVDKSTIPDPTSLAYAGSFRRLAYAGNISPSSKTLNVGESFTVTASSEGVILGEVIWSSSNTAVATVDASGKVTAVSKGTAVISYQAGGTAVSGNEAVSGLTGSCSVTVNESLGKGSVTVDNASVVLAVNAKGTVKATAANFTAGKELVYSMVSSNTEVATATVDGSGNISVTGLKAGDAALTVTVNYKDGGTAESAASAVINVKVTANKTITLDKTAATVYIGTPVTVNATIANATSDAAVTAETSDGNIATVSVSGRAVTITGVKPGTANITVKYTENGEEVKTACAVTVKANPKEDRTNKLKDKDGNQLFVQDNNTYREAVYADYYTASKFFVKNGIKYTGWQTIDGKVYYFDKDGNKITGEQVIQGAKYNFASDGSLVTGSGTRGIDVSKWNGSIDWKAVKNSGIDYVIIRCGYRGSSQGALIQDPKYTANIKGATAAGLKVGVYFFTQAVSEAEAVEEASMVLDLVKNYKISYPVFLDVEGSGGRGDKIDKNTRTAVIKAFCRTIQDAGYTAGVYANKSWFTSKIDAGQLNAYKIWLAQYASAPTYTGRYDLWQYQSTGRVSGISGNVDMNWSYLGY